jgi:hypothetical protein
MLPAPARIPGDHGSARVTLTGGTSTVPPGTTLAGGAVVGAGVVVVPVRPRAPVRAAVVVVEDWTVVDEVVLDGTRVVGGVERPPVEAGGFVTCSPSTFVDESGELLPTASAIAKPAITAAASNAPASVPY